MAADTGDGGKAGGTSGGNVRRGTIRLKAGAADAEQRTPSERKTARKPAGKTARKSRGGNASATGNGRTPSRRKKPQRAADNVWHAARPGADGDAGGASSGVSRRRTAGWHDASGKAADASDAPVRRRRGERADTREKERNARRQGQKPRSAGNRVRNAQRSGQKLAEQPFAGRAGQTATQHTGAEQPSAAPSRPVSAASGAGSREGVRLNRYLAQHGYCSRREADAWIERGWVTVNGAPAQMGQRVGDSDLVHVEQRAQQRQAAKVTILINKPIGYVSGQAEDGYEPASVLVTAASRWQEQGAGRRDSTRFEPSHRRGLAVAGRLDIDSTGLLVLTQDGRIARQLIGENSDTEKEYLVRVRYRDVEHNVEAVFPQQQLQLLCHGLSLDGKPLKPAQVQWQNPEQLRFVLREGKKRQIRRMCEAVGLNVVGLKRVRIGNVLLGRLPQGQWRYLLPGETF